MMNHAAAATVTAVLLSGCAVNPVTGERHLQFYGSDWENQVGAQMYAPMKQSQGGEFILDPELSEYVSGIGQRLARQARRREELNFEFGIINSSVPNAWALPGGKIVVNRGLLTELDSEAELAAVLGHEIVHADAAHGARAQSKGMLTQVGAVAGMVILGSRAESPAAREIGMLVPSLGAQLLTQKYGRDAEREADEYGMRYMAEAGYDTQGAVELQETFLELSEGRRQDWLSGLFASHPPSRERLENNRQTAAALAAEGYPGGDTGRDAWRARTAYLDRVQPAYDAYDKAYEAASKENWQAAQEYLNKALSIEPRESLFHDLQGDIHAMREDYRPALAAYDRAVAANDRFFYGWLRRGQVHYKLDEPQAARRDLERSLELMPTSEAHYLLGKIDLAENRRQSAAEHFKAAVQSESRSGLNAERELLRMDLPGGASSYVEVRAVASATGEVWIQVGNQTRTPLRNIVYRYVWIDEQGRTRQGEGVFDGVLEGGRAAQQLLDARLDNPAELDRRVRVEITAATVAQ